MVFLSGFGDCIAFTETFKRVVFENQVVDCVGLSKKTRAFRQLKGR